MTRTELYADQRMNLQEAQADRIANLEKKTDATIDHIARLEKMLKESEARIEMLEENSFLDKRRTDILVERIKMLEAISFRDEDEDTRLAESLNKKQEPNLLDDLFGDPVKQLENLWKKAGEVK